MRKLEECAIESVRDVNEGEPQCEWFTEDEGREHLIEMMQDGDLDYDDLERIIERRITEQERKNLEWRF